MGPEGKKWGTPKNVVVWGGVLGHVLGGTQPGKKKCMNMFWDISQKSSNWFLKGC